MDGIITKGIAGFYYVDVAESGVYACRARGIFRKEGTKPLPGDRVAIDDLGGDPPEGSIREIYPRKNEMLRPAVANIDVCIAVMAFAEPSPNWNLLDSYLLLMEERDIPAAICFNKTDLADEAERESARRRYAKTGYPIFFTSASDAQSISGLREFLCGKTAALAGPSGVGKSTLTNALSGGKALHMETGELSAHTKRGRHTTRHAELLSIGDGAYLMDTPGFTSLDLTGIDPLLVREMFPEIRGVSQREECRFSDCAHDREPDCAVKDAVSRGEIPKERYESYLQLYHMCKENAAR